MLQKDAAKFFEQLCAIACKLSAKPEHPLFGITYNLLSDKQTQKVFNGLLQFAAEVPAEDRAALFNHCLEKFSKYTFPAVLSVKKLIQHKFLLELAKLMPDERQACSALSKIQEKSSAESFLGLQSFLAFEATVQFTDSIKDEQLRGAALCETIEKYPAAKLDRTGRLAALNQLLTRIDNIKDQQVRHTVLSQLIKHHPTCELMSWEVMPALTALLKSVASLSDVQQRQLMIGAVIYQRRVLRELEPGPAAKSITALMGAIHTFPSDQERLNVLSAFFQQHGWGMSKAVQAEERLAVLAALTQSCEGFSEPSARESAMQLIQKWFAMAVEQQGVCA